MSTMKRYLNREFVGSGSLSEGQNIYDAFTNRHPLFLWMFRASHYWPSVLPLLPAMRAHLQQLGLKIHRMGSRVSSRSGSHIGFKLTTATGERIEQYSLVFRELFCVAASELASVLRVDLERLGILYNEVVPTGTNLDEYPTLPWFRSYPRAVNEHTDEETARGLIIGRGQLLFIVNQVSAADVATFRSNGFRFASLKDVLPIISRTMQVPKMHFQSYIDKMRRYVGKQEFREPGIFMSCFVVRPSLKSGFDVVVCKRFVNMLPSVQLPISMLQKWQEDYLRQLDSFNIASMRERLIKDSRSVDTNTHKRIFTTQLLEALEKLRRRFTEGSLSEATFIAQTFQAPCRSSALGLTAATLLSFRMIVPVHMRQPPGNDLVFWPLNMFKTQQRVYKQSRGEDTA